MSNKIQKVIVRLQEKIKEGQFYEAQQQTRVVAARHVKSKDWASAIDILFNVAQSLLKAGQGGSGGDLGIMLVDVYKQAELKPDFSNKSKLVTLLPLFDSEEPTRKKFIGDMISWSSKYGEYPAGDPDIHHVVGSLLAEEHDVYEAERHLTLGTRDSPEVFAKLEFEWYLQDDSHTAALYAARVVFAYLLAGNVRDANKSLQTFTDTLNTARPQLDVREVKGLSFNLQIYPSIPLLNFLGLLLQAIQKGSPDIYRNLNQKYSTYIKEVGLWDDTLALIGELYFEVPRPRKGNPIFDMMGSIFGGGAAKPQPKRVGIQETPVADSLD
ncbi:BgTH12-01998 [Blumeria graminis f. sp. triticale]|uniref:Bgt-3641 n=3 Tax=Blumeria graminis TaxID=34373 RepID=A0A9X9MFI8_BLUGR|nr:hypothetical protein BGT96224_3641 [Blumeria graminis f. sp. tritici 96224]CAD6501749.1 BgTH12-01998 [Blumeria graminis f. sp. triticale]VDB84398.1 Bgt-3641 [Blumeria graminis f. sp. tritici]